MNRPGAAPPGAAAIAGAIARGEVSAEAVMTETLSRLAETRPLGAVVHDDAELALRGARALDAARRRGEPLGPLAGVPLAVKDNICTRDLPTTCGSALLRGWIAPYEATAVARLRAAGAIVVAKTNCDEFGMGSSTEFSCYGPTRNPHDLERVPGGSSGGSAALVAATAVPLALGSDTGGSVRQPAALCGCFGLKPTYGRVSRYGLVAFGSSLDQIGVMAQSTADLALALGSMAGVDPHDDSSAAVEVPDYGAARELPVRGLRVGIWRRTLQLGVEPAIAAAVEAAAGALADAGAMVEEFDLPLGREALSIYYVLATAEASSNLARFDGVRFGVRRPGADLAATYAATRAQGFGPEVIRRIVLGTYVLSAGYHDRYYGKAQAARTVLRRALDRLTARHDLLLLPTTPGTAFRLGEKQDDPLQMYLCDVFTVPANLGGHPALSIPAPRAAGALPIGVQLLAARFGEPQLLRAAAELERRGFRGLAA